MFELFSKVFSAVLSKLLSASVDAGSKELAWRRSSAGAFIDLFDALSCLIESSNDAERTFSEYRERDVATKGEVSNRMSALLRDVEQFDATLSRVESKLGIYDRDLLVVLEDVASRKKKNLILLDFLTDVAPKHVSSSYDVIYPVDLPSLNELTVEVLKETLSPSRESYGDISRIQVADQHSRHLPSERRMTVVHRINERLPPKEFQDLRKRLKAKFKMSRANLLVPAEAKVALGTATQDIARLEQSQGQLADFIKREFPLSAVLK